LPRNTASECVLAYVIHATEEVGTEAGYCSDPDLLVGQAKGLTHQRAVPAV